MRRILRRSIATTAVITLGLGAVSCGTDEQGSDDTSAAAAGESTGDDVVEEDDPAEDDVAVDSIVGLEVTAVGNVSEVLSDEAMRIDRDGLGGDDGDEEQAGSVDAWDYDYDYDYYDYTYLTEFDEEYGDADVVDDGVLVVDAAGLSDVDPGQSVRVSGTVRRFDQDVIESLYEVDLADDVFDGYADSLVIVADSVKPVSAAAATEDATASGSASESASESAGG